jgi:ankyrin repeat protein
MSKPSSTRFCDLKGVIILIVAVSMMLIFVAQCGYRFAVARWSLEHWADDDDLNKLVIAIENGWPADRVGALSTRVEVNARDNLDYTPLMHAVWAGRLDVCRSLIDRGADVNASTQTGLNPLKLAAAHGDESVLRLLLSRGGNVDGPTSSGRTALMVACCAGNDELAAVLLQAGSNVNAKSIQGLTPMIDAASASPTTPQTLRLIQRLSDAGGDVNAADNDGSTPLMEATRNDSAQTVALLRSLGADVCARDHRGRDAITIARQAHCADALAALLAERTFRPSSGEITKKRVTDHHGTTVQ